MKSKKLGDYIQLVDNRNINSTITLLRGVSTQKKLIESVANMSGVSLHNYKILNTRQFVYVADTSRRGEKIGLAFNTEEPCIVSSIYTTFKIIDESKLLPEYLFMFFNRSEFDRYCRFNSWGSARETFDWQDMCEVLLPVPSIDEQRKYVAIYQGILNNQKTYEQSLDDLQLICDGYIENLIRTVKHKRLGNFIQLVNKSNDLGIKIVKGVSNEKKLIKTKANMTDVDISKYSLVEKNQFVYRPVVEGLNAKISIALNHGETCVVSKIYPVFEIIDKNILLPEYLFLFFKRSEFDRYANFHSWGSARETFDWQDMCEVKLPIPDIKIQEAIVKIYHTLETRKRINEQLKNSIKPLCPILMKGVADKLNKQ
ncbi:restriction endonuclease subunit S [Aliarcobacter butzleri]